MTNNSPEKQSSFIPDTVRDLFKRDDNPIFLIFGAIFLIGCLFLLFDLGNCSYKINIGLLLIGISLLFAIIRIFIVIHDNTAVKHAKEIERNADLHREERERMQNLHNKHVEDFKEAIKLSSENNSRGMEASINAFKTIQNNTDSKLS